MSAEPPAPQGAPKHVPDAARQAPEAPVRGVTAHARIAPERPALIVGDAVRTYGELDDRARRLAAALAERGAGPAKTVAAVLPNGFEPLEVALAASMLDAPYLPVNWHLKAAELVYLLDDAQAAVVVGHAEATSELPAERSGHAPLLVGAGDERDYEAAIAAAPADPSLDAGPGPELVFYTSGTTAHPKGVVHAGMGSLEGRTRAMEGQSLLWGWSTDDVYVLAGPGYHASHAGWALTALYAGATTVVLERFSAIGWLAAVDRWRGTRSFMVPAHFIRLIEVPDEERARYDTSSLRLIVHAAAPCPVAVKRRTMELFPTAEVHELYGASEGGATRISPQEWLERPGSVGRPWPGVEVRVLDEEGRPVPTGEPGIVWIRPPGGQRFTYRNDPEATAEAWRGDAFSVGDIGVVDEEGYLTITDRVSDMVLWGGVNIAPREIEEVLYEHPAVVDCAVFGIPDERDGEHLKAIVELRAPATPEELAAHVRSQLADYKVPHVWEVVDELPRDASGKVRKRLLRQAHEG